jgi:hypothetical protein
MANYVDQWLKMVAEYSEAGLKGGTNYLNWKLPISGTVNPFGFMPFGGNNIVERRTTYAKYANNLNTIKSQLARGLTDAERNSYMRDYEQAINTVGELKNEYLPYWQAEDQKKQQQEALQKQQEELARQKAEQERLRAEQEAKAREQAAALEQQRQAAEKARKEAEFKSALDAMNQRANVKRTDEVVGEMSETPEQAAQRKKKRVGYDATKVTGILGAAPTESKKLLGM